MIVRINVPERSIILTYAFMYVMLIKSSEGTCIKRIGTYSSEDLILNSVNESMCVRIDGENQTVISKIQVNRTCARETDVKVMALVNGQQDCVMQEFLFAHQEKSGCSMDTRCQSKNGIPYGNNATLCLLKCPIDEGTGESYELQLTSGYEPRNLELCGLQTYQVNWIQPDGWTGPDPTLYRSFDTPEHLTLMEGTVETNFAALVQGLINSAVSTDRTKRQWIDLGIHTEVCMTRPDTCSSAGGAISLWVKLINCPDWTGVITTRESGTGLILYCKEHVRCDVRVQDGTFRVRIVKPTGWTHLVLNYIGPNTGEGIKIFNNGWEAHSDRTKWNASLTSGDGRIVVGRYYTDRDQNYASVEIDELIFFNQF